MESQKSLLDRLKPYFVAVAVIIALAIGTRQCFYEQTYVIGDLGMDDIGRQVFCRTLDAEAKSSGDIRVLCEGFHKQTIVISMKNAAPILFGRIKPDDVLEQMKKTYSEGLKGLKGLVLRGDKLANKVDNTVPIVEIESRLERLRAKTIADFYAACGFEKFIIRDEEKKQNYLDLTFSNKHYGNNPVKTE